MIYEYKCPTCLHSSTQTRPVANRHDPLACTECGGAMRLVITGGAGFSNVMGGHNFPGYQCPVTDRWVSSRRQRREIMAEHDLREHSSADTPGVHR